MINYTCDVCGNQMPRGYKRAKPEVGIKLINVTKAEDICPSCLKVGSKLDAAAILMGAWKEAAEQALPPDEGGQADEKKPKAESKSKTQAVVDKAAVMNRLAAYKETNGLSAMPALEKAIGRKGISIPVLLDASVGAGTFPVETWAAINRGLDKLNAPEAGNGENN